MSTDRQIPGIDVKRVTGYVLLYAGIVLFAALFWHRPFVVAAAYLLFSVALLARWRSRQERVMYALAFVLGPLAEMAGVSRGAWIYPNSEWMLPVWLPFAWGLTALFLLRLARAIGLESGSR